MNYDVEFSTTFSVEADNEDEAYEKALDEALKFGLMESAYVYINGEPYC